MLVIAKYGQGGHKTRDTIIYIDFNMIEIHPVSDFQLVMLSFVGKKTCCCWFYIVDQLK